MSSNFHAAHPTQSKGDSSFIFQGNIRRGDPLLNKFENFFGPFCAWNCQSDHTALGETQIPPLFPFPVLTPAAKAVDLAPDAKFLNHPRRIIPISPFRKEGMGLGSLVHYVFGVEWCLLGRRDDGIRPYYQRSLFQSIAEVLIDVRFPSELQLDKLRK